MSINVRQSELFAGEQWQVLYAAYSSINFNASDPGSIGLALRTYIQTNYPEDFNDWIESSEFVAILDLLAWLAGTLAFKTDISVRENFLETAESRESVLRLARFLSYNPARNQASRGVLKLMQISTNDDVYDSLGTNLANTTITWNNPDDPDWNERFTAVLNAAFVTTNPYGVPLKQGNVQNVEAQLYRLNGFVTGNPLGFTATAGGNAMDFEICNGDFDDGGILKERSPNPLNAMHIYHLADGNGNGSTRTGFFALFKQGTTRRETYYLPYPIENQLIDASAANINNSDVWVQTVDDTGTVMIDWTNVPVMLDENITYNTLPISDRNIYSIITRDNDQVSIRFSDGRYGNAPSGNIQLTYRVSAGTTYAIKPQEINYVQIPFNYINANGVVKSLTLTFSLLETVSNATAAETIQQIRQRAPMVYATQNRMVSGEDYNSFPLKENLAAKIKAVNRVYSGHSRYIDLHDPTGTYQDLSIFADDASLFVEPANQYREIPLTLNRTVAQIVEGYILPMLSTNETVNAMRDTLLKFRVTVPNGMAWMQSNASLYSSTGYFNITQPNILVGSMLQFLDNSAKSKWVGVSAINGAITTVSSLNTAGNVTLSEPVSTGSIVTAILPNYVTTLPAAIVIAIEEKLSKKLSFSLSYDYTSLSNNGWSVQAAVSNLSISGTTISVLAADYLPGLWRLTSRGIRFVFESTSTIEWFDDGSRAVDQQTGQGSSDLIKVLKINEDRNAGLGRGLRQDYNFTIDKLWFYENGNAEPRRTKVVLSDSNADGFPDNPDALLKLLPTSNSYLYWKLDDNSMVQPIFNVMGYANESDRIGNVLQTNKGQWNAATNTPPLATSLAGDYYTVSTSGQTLLNGNSNWVVGSTVVYNGQAWVVGPTLGSVAFQVGSNSASRAESFWLYTVNGWAQDFSQTYSFARGRGPNVALSWVDGTVSSIPSGDSLVIQWKHYAPSDHRIDPASQNLHDIFVLTYEYDTLVRQWLKAGAITADLPPPPNELALRIAFGDLENFRMFSDGIVWRPVRYKLLFGNAASEEVRMTFKVIRLPNATLADGEIKSRIIATINDYFSVSLWDFGETFYWSELAAYIHQKLANVIGSIVPVPQNAAGAFGDGFEVSCRPDEIFISTAQVSDVVIINSNTPANLRIR